MFDVVISVDGQLVTVRGTPSAARTLGAEISLVKAFIKEPQLMESVFFKRSFAQGVAFDRNVMERKH